MHKFSDTAWQVIRSTDVWTRQFHMYMVRPLEPWTSDGNHSRMEKADTDMDLYFEDLFLDSRFLVSQWPVSAWKCPQPGILKGSLSIIQEIRRACFIFKSPLPVPVACGWGQTLVSWLVSACKLSYAGGKQHQLNWQSTTFSILFLSCQEGLTECSMAPSPDSEIHLENWKKNQWRNCRLIEGWEVNAKRRLTKIQKKNIVKEDSEEKEN